MIKESANYRLLLQGICVINCYAMIYNKGSSWQMGRHYVQSSLFYGVLVRTDIRSFAPIFLSFSVFSVFCALIGGYKIQPKYRFSAQPIGIPEFYFASAIFSCRKAFSTGNIVQYNRLQPMPVFAGLRSFILPFTV